MYLFQFKAIIFHWYNKIISKQICLEVDGYAVYTEKEIQIYYKQKY